MSYISCPIAACARSWGHKAHQLVSDSLAAGRRSEDEQSLYWAVRAEELVEEARAAATTAASTARIARPDLRVPVLSCPCCDSQQISIAFGTRATCIPCGASSSLEAFQTV